VIESVCVTKATGAVRDAANGCSSFEVLVTLPGDPPAAFCASNYTVTLRYISANATCRSHETAVSLDSGSEATICINKYTRVLRKASQTGTCRPHEILAVLGSGVVPTGCVYDEVEPNQDPETAMDLDSYTWCLDENSNITDSTSVPHITVNGTGDDTVDIYAFTIPSAGTTATFDIDFGWMDPCDDISPCVDFDSALTLYDSGFNEIDSNDDTDDGDLGSEFSFLLDSYLTNTFDTPGTYYIEVSSYDGTGVPAGETYQLHVLVEGHSVP
jgi:hypothetical protein